MMEYGLLPPEAAQKVYERKLRKNHQSKQNSPAKVASSEPTADSAKKAKQASAGMTAPRMAVKRKLGGASSDDGDDNDDDDDFISSRRKPKKRKVAG